MMTIEQAVQIYSDCKNVDMWNQSQDSRPQWFKDLGQNGWLELNNTYCDALETIAKYTVELITEDKTNDNN